MAVASTHVPRLRLSLACWIGLLRRPVQRLSCKQGEGCIPIHPWGGYLGHPTALVGDPSAALSERDQVNARTRETSAG